MVQSLTVDGCRIQSLGMLGAGFGVPAFGVKHVAGFSQ